MPTDSRAVCQRAREWLSAFRDGEATDQPVLRAHVETCTACAAWDDRVATLTRRARVGHAGHPDLVAPALAPVTPDRHPVRRTVGRVLLALASTAILVMVAGSVVDLAGYFAAAGGHLGWELYAFHAGLAAGFALAAAHPARFVPGLLPVTACVVGLTLVQMLQHLRLDPTAFAEQVAHAGLVVGLAGLLLLAFDRETSPSPASAHRHPVDGDGQEGLAA